MNRIISEELFKKAISIMATYASSNPKWTYQDVEQDPSGVHATLEQLRNAPLATTFDGTGVRQWTPYEIAIAKGDGILLGRHRFYLDDDLATIQNAGQVGGDDDGEPIHQVGWIDPKDPTRIQVTTHYMIRELGNPENWVPLYAPNDGTTQPQPVHGVPSEQRCKCPRCGSEEIDAMTARTVYDCGSSDYDARPGTFRQSDKCTLLTGRQEGR